MSEEGKAELKSILDRMHRHEQAIKTDVTFKDSPYYHSVLGEYWTWDADAIGDGYAALARMYLREHPADDEVPVTEEWLTSIDLGIERGEKFHSQLLAKVSSTMVGFHLDAHGLLVSFGDGYYTNRCYMGKTRGDVRRLCKCLGIELKEGKPGG